MRIGLRRTRVMCAGVVCAGALALLSPAVSHGYTHSWSCPSAGSAAQCYDFTGTIYNPWIQVSEQNEFFNVVHEVCAKGVTAAGNQRSAHSGYSLCELGVYRHTTCFAGSTPNSQAYVYWDGSGPAIPIDGFAATPASSGCP